MFPRDMVCLRNISVDTLHKEDTEDNNDDNNNNNRFSSDYYTNSFELPSDFFYLKLIRSIFFVYIII
jgi:hypothetical protein